MQLRRRHLLVVACASVLLAGCGASRSATYVDPNPDSLFAGAGSTAVTSQPFTTYGADVAQRALALVRLRGSLATARVLQPSDPSAAQLVVKRAFQQDFSVIEPTLELGRPALCRQLRSELQRLSTTPPRDVAGYAATIQQLTSTRMTTVETVVIPIAARQDAAFRAGVLIDSVDDAAIRYGNAVEGGLSNDDAEAEYRTAYGILLDVRTRGLDAISIDDRRKAQSLVTTAVNRALPSPNLPSNPRDATIASTELSLASDYLATSSGADTTLPSPDPSSPELWRALKRSISTTLVEFDNGNITGARQQARDSAQALSPVATASLASVDPDAVVTILHGLAIELPAQLRDGGDPETAAAHIDAAIDSAVTAIEQELKLLRQTDEAG